MFNAIDDLERIIKVLRDQGVDRFKFNGLELEMGSLPLKESHPEAAKALPSQSELDRAVGMPVGGFDDPFLDYSVHEPNEDSEA